jgi:hypothetical protein
MSSWDGQGGHSAGALARDARHACIAIARRASGCEANSDHEDARSITARTPRGNFSRTQHRAQVRPPWAHVPRAAGANGDHARAAIATTARKSRRRRRKTQNQGMLVDPVVNGMLWT